MRLPVQHVDEATLKELRVEFTAGASDFKAGEISSNSKAILHFSPLSIERLKEFLGVTDGLSSQKDFYVDNAASDSEHIRYGS